MSKLAIFYHVYQYGQWVNIHTEQILKLQQSGVYDAADYVHIGGMSPNIYLPFELTKANYKFEYDVKSEFNTLKSLYNFSVENPDYKCLFIHSKGVTWSDLSEQNNPIYHYGYPDSNYKSVYEHATIWRNYMEYFVVQNWQRCVELLDKYDCVGTEWMTEAHFKESSDIKNYSFYSGNFWWANARYIKTLDLNFIENPTFHLIGLDNRHTCEVWIGTQNPKHYNFFTSNKNLYLDKIYEHEYAHLASEPL